MHAFNYECGNLEGFQKKKRMWKENGEIIMCEVIQFKSWINANNLSMAYALN